jgi:hypothetical protein
MNTIPFDCYLIVEHCQSGETYVQEIKPNWVIGLETRIKHWLKTEYCDELALDGELMPSLPGEYYARIMTDNRQPDSVVCWDAAGFYVKTV